MRNGSEYVEGLKDGRTIIIDGEPVEDVTTHPAFKGIVQTISKLYDLSADKSNNMQYVTEDGTVANKIYMAPRNREQLVDRRIAINKWAEISCGFCGRSPDHVASFIAGFASWHHIFERQGEKFGKNILNFYKYVRDNDLYVTYVIIPPQVDRSKKSNEFDDPFLQVGVYQEKNDGIIVRGAQMLGTAAAVSDWLFVSCIKPLHPGEENSAISFAVPINAKGLKLYPRASYAEHKPSPYDYPLSSMFDESDSFVIFDDVFVPWDHVFVYKDIKLLQAQFHETPAHIWGNVQAQTRFVTKLKFILGVSRKVASLNGIDKIPSVQEKLGELASLASSVEGALLASEYTSSIDELGFARPNPRFLYGVVGQQDTLYASAIKILRELCGGGVLQLPSSYLELIQPETRDDMKKYVRSPQCTTEEKVQLLKLVWDIIGSEFGGRHQQYEIFYNGAPFVTKGYAYRKYGYEEPVQLVDRFLSSYSIPQNVLK